jgi:hypothetical protein
MERRRIDRSVPPVTDRPAGLEGRSTDRGRSREITHTTAAAAAARDRRQAYMAWRREAYLCHVPADRSIDPTQPLLPPVGRGSEFKAPDRRRTGKRSVSGSCPLARPADMTTRPACTLACSRGRVGVMVTVACGGRRRRWTRPAAKSEAARSSGGRPARGCMASSRSYAAWPGRPAYYWPRAGAYDRALARAGGGQA